MVEAGRQAISVRNKMFPVFVGAKRAQGNQSITSGATPALSKIATGSAFGNLVGRKRPKVGTCCMPQAKRQTPVVVDGWSDDDQPARNTSVREGEFGIGDMYGMMSHSDGEGSIIGMLMERHKGKARRVDAETADAVVAAPKTTRTYSAFVKSMLSELGDNYPNSEKKFRFDTPEIDGNRGVVEVLLRRVCRRRKLEGSATGGGCHDFGIINIKIAPEQKEIGLAFLESFATAAQALDGGVFIEESIIIANHHEWLQELLSVGSLAVIEGHCVSIKAL